MPNLRKREHLLDIVHIVLCDVDYIAELEAPVFDRVNPSLPYGINFDITDGATEFRQESIFTLAPSMNLKIALSAFSGP